MRDSATNSGGKRAWARYSLLALRGLAIVGAALLLIDAGMSLRIRERTCPLPSALTHRFATWELNTRTLVHMLRGRVAGRDRELGLVQIASPWGAFWVEEAGSETDGPTLVSYLIAEHAWMEFHSPGEQVRPGDIVIDCGAHVGSFTRFALNRGAKRVIAIEPNPVNLECLRRNFREEIASQKVLLMPFAAWDSETALKFGIAGNNSGTGSAVLGAGERSITVAARRIDDLLGEAQVERVDYIKMDIEGAERNALRGAMGILRRDHPRLLLEAYHLPDDPVVLPSLLNQAWSGYTAKCGTCKRDDRDGRLKPYVLYFR